MDKIDIARSIVKEHQAQRVKWRDGQKNRTLLLDVFTASAIIKVYEAVNDANKAKLLAMEWPRLAMVCVKALAK